MSFLKTVEFKTCICTYVCFDYLCSKEVTVVSCMITEEELCLSTFFKNNEYSTVDHQVYI